MEVAMPSPIASEARNSRALAALRIAVGLFFLNFGEYKVFGTQFTLHGGFPFWISKILSQGGADPFIAAIFPRFCLTHATPLAFLVAYFALASRLMRWHAREIGLSIPMFSRADSLFLFCRCVVSSPSCAPGCRPSPLPPLSSGAVRGIPFSLPRQL